MAYRLVINLMTYRDL